MQQVFFLLLCVCCVDCGLDTKVCVRAHSGESVCTCETATPFFLGKAPHDALPHPVYVCALYMRVPLAEQRDGGSGASGGVVCAR